MKVTIQIELNNHTVAAQVIALAKVLDNGTAAMLQIDSPGQLSITARDALTGCSSTITSIVGLLNHYGGKAALIELLMRHIDDKFISEIKADLDVIEYRLSKDST